MSLTSIRGFLPILDIITTPLPLFLATLSLSTIPFFVVKLSLMADYLDLFHMFRTQGFPMFNRRTYDNTFDFIVVGGGSGGSAVAARLSQTYRVLLIEAGGDPHPLTYIPLMTEPLLNQQMIDWQYRTVSLNNTGFVWPNQQMAWPRGKSLGGSSNSNHMVYMRGNPEDFNNWARHTGDSRWAYDNVQEKFKRLEDYHGHWAGSAHHGDGGPMHIERAHFNGSSSYWLDAGKEIGKRVLDPNSYQSEGFFPLDVTQRKGIRFSTYRGYIEPNLENGNLTIHRYSIATKIHFDDAMKAIGVTYFRHAIQQYATASKEIIVSCGTINSPKLLMLSGIGPTEHLESIGISPLVDLKVGGNLQDHVLGIAGPFLLNKNVSFLRSRDITPLVAAEYLATGTGPFSSADGLDATALISSNKATKDWPDTLMMHIGRGVDQNMGREMEQAFGMASGAFASFLEYNAMNDSNFVLVAVGRPKSRGFIKLRDNDPFSKPIIDPKYFSDERGEDMDVLLQGIKFVVNLYENTSTFQSLEARLAPNHLPGCESHELKSDSYWECYLRSVTCTMFHPAGTCAMGKSDHPDSVVDSQLRVLGTKGLRIADASVMPFITNANLNAPTIMIGEMCADMIHDEWKSEIEAQTGNDINSRRIII